MPAAVNFRINNIARWLDEPTSVLSERIADKLRISETNIADLRVVREVLDARKKNSPRYIYTLEFSLAEGKVPKNLPPDVVVTTSVAESIHRVARFPEQKPIIIGTGPAGLFCAFALLERGVKSVLVERGREVIQRRKDVALLMRDGSLNAESNMNFGEGGAGAYTDGKLSTRINHPMVRKVIETFAHFGAPDRILIQGKPHIGSDLLPFAVERLRKQLTDGGCEVLFETKVTDILSNNDRVTGVKLSDGRILESDRVILVPGNSARELFETFAADNRIFIEPKPFALGFRAEHPQTLINSIQYGDKFASGSALPPADYKLAENIVVNGETRGIYSFCMCPGGIVVPTPTEEGMQCTNGMSNSHRNSKFANAGVVVSVTIEDFAREGYTGPLAGIQFQRHWEKKAYELGGGNYFAPAQSIPDYLAGTLKKKPGKTTYCPGLVHADLNRLFPERLTLSLKQALKKFEHKMHGFVSEDGMLMGIESRTSTPLRVTRDEQLQSVSMRGLYPGGEGCGYAGGIVSSGIDGLRIAEQIASELS